MAYVSESGEFTRDTRYLHDDITPEPGRYRLVVSRACPWASRAIVVRRLLGLEDALGMGICGPVHDEHSWTFDLDPGGRDPVLGIERLEQAYLARDPSYDRGVTVPALVEISTGKVVSNDYPRLTLEMSTDWTAYHRPGAPDLYPVALREEMDEVMELVYRDVNNGVYRCGFAADQEAYEKAYHQLFDRIDWLNERLQHQRYLMGDTITEADVRLFTTLVRFDVVYHSHFKCNRSKLSEIPVLWAYARDLFQTPGFGDTVDFEQIKQHYYVVQADVNPTRIVPLGPDTSDWHTAHHREVLGGKPFGDGTAPEPEAMPSLSFS